MKGLKFKIVVGFRKEQSYTIDAEDINKAYRLFMNPNERAIFKNGLALIGQNIQSIEPDYNATMRWNPSHQLDDEDWNQIKKEGIDIKLRDLLQEAKKEALYISPQQNRLN